MSTGDPRPEPAGPRPPWGGTYEPMDSDSLLKILNLSSEVQRAQQILARAIREEAYARGITEGRRQATEGWEREWAVELPSGDDRLDALNEKAARWFASRAPGRGVVSRLAGPWEPAEQPGDELLPLTMEGHVHVRRESPAEIAREVGEASDVH